MTVNHIAPVQIDIKKCSRCRCSRPYVDFLTRLPDKKAIANGVIKAQTRKTCKKCRESAKNRKRDKTKQKEYARNWRKRNPKADNRDRREYHRLYNLRKKQEKELET